MNTNLNCSEKNFWKSFKILCFSLGLKELMSTSLLIVNQIKINVWYNFWTKNAMENQKIVSLIMWTIDTIEKKYENVFFRSKIDKISPNFYEQHFLTKVFYAAFLYLQFVFVIFCLQEIGEKTAHNFTYVIGKRDWPLLRVMLLFKIIHFFQLITVCAWNLMLVNLTTYKRNWLLLMIPFHLVLCFTWWLSMVMILGKTVQMTASSQPGVVKLPG